MKFLVKGAKFLAAEALIVCTFIAQIISVFSILTVQCMIPAFRRLFEVNDNLMYILPVLAVLFLNLLFVKLNNKFFQLRLRDVIKYFFIAAIVCIILVVLLGLLVSFLFSLIPESTRLTITNVAVFPFAMLLVLGGPSVFFMMLGLISLAFVCIIVFPLTLFTGFFVVSLYEKLPRIPKKTVNLLIKVLLLAYLITVVVFGFRRSVNDMLKIDRGIEYDESFYRTIKQIHRQGDYDFAKDNLGVFSSMVKLDYPFKCLELFIDYGFDLKEHEAYLSYVHSKEQMKFFVERGIDPNIFIIDIVKDSKYGYETIAMLVDAGADVNKKSEYGGGSKGEYSVIMWYLTYLDRRMPIWSSEAYEEALKVLDLLIERGADLNYRCSGKENDFYGPMTALGCLLTNYGLDRNCYYRDSLVIYLMDKGADPKICLPSIYTLQDLYNWHNVSDFVLERMAEGGVKKGRWTNQNRFFDPY